ncbi:hypothetical protein PGIGA_G00203460 [Pangasianodon gigas]|uniref:Uncharacterized protein n=1 Tax=Pangasianodon gigas TaxID=30993 RepID=A0ACC5WEC9_PANGG|nr:hypothetical protein [Pangasianodon gigas]
MTAYYKFKIDKFLNITNVTLSEGKPFNRLMQSKWIEKAPKSVNVKHDIVVEIENYASEKYDKLFVTVQEAVKSLTNCTPTLKDCPNFTVTEVQVNKTVLTEKEFCEQVTAMLPEEYRHYFSPVTVLGKLTCVSQCHREHPSPKICMNKGTCEVSKQGPACYCLHSDTNWYLGEDCKYQVHKVGVYAGMAVVTVVLVLAVAVFSAYVLLNKRKQKRNKDNKEALVNQWIDDDFEWPSEKRSNESHSVVNETYDNPAQSNEENTSQNTTPHRTASSTHPSSPQFNLPQNVIPFQYLGSSHPMRISKPQIHTSSSRPEIYNFDV